ncbi:hypothetical protein BDQ12DRAFT_660952 [Crucibulum laeve]|uniref:Uncharacterized protein n=1 Tax=Crucibulum laeve TaxID=68775 RepID=A0A5C3MFK4_9AGAR|nr:hypothetical protein BDQ12DRAFT_660952 [Crucibulum laeve]
MSPSTARLTVNLLSSFDIEAEKSIEEDALYADIASARKTQNADDGFSCPYLFKELKEYAIDSTRYPSELMVQVIHSLAAIFESRGEYSPTNLEVTGGIVWYGIVASHTINNALHIPLAKLYDVLNQWICQPQLKPICYDALEDFNPDPRYDFFCNMMSYTVTVSHVVPPDVDEYFRSHQHREMLTALEVLFRSAFAKYSKKYFSENLWDAVNLWPAFRDKTLLVTLPGVKDVVVDI